VEAQIEAMVEEPMTCVRSEDWAAPPDRRCGRALHRVLQEHVPVRAGPAWPEDRGRLRHGAAYHIAPHVFHELGAEVISIGNQPDGRNINAGYGATAPEKLVEAVGARRRSRPGSTATPTACRWWTPMAGCTTATSCST
jgi:phosphoglucosamine mutase